MLPNRAVEIVEEVACPILAGEHIEVVLPEVDEDLFQLPFAEHSARHPAGGQLTKRLDRPTRLLAQPLRVDGRHGAIATARCRRQRHGRWRKLGQQPIRRVRQRSILTQQRIGGMIGKALRLQLPSDPGVHPQAAYRVHIVRPCPERQSVEDVLYLLVGRLFPQGAGGWRGFGRRPAGTAAAHPAGARREQAHRESDAGGHSAGTPARTSGRFLPHANSRKWSFVWTPRGRAR